MGLRSGRPLMGSLAAHGRAPAQCALAGYMTKGTGTRRILGLLPREESWRARSVCRAMRAAVHGMPDLAFWLALTAGPLSGAGMALGMHLHAFDASGASDAVR